MSTSWNRIPAFFASFSMCSAFLSLRFFWMNSCSTFSGVLCRKLSTAWMPNIFSLWLIVSSNSFCQSTPETTCPFLIDSHRVRRLSCDYLSQFKSWFLIDIVYFRLFLADRLVFFLATLRELLFLLAPVFFFGEVAFLFRNCFFDDIACVVFSNSLWKNFWWTCFGFLYMRWVGFTKTREQKFKI